MQKENIYGKTITELKNLCFSFSLPSYTADQLANWLYKKHTDSFDKMSNISKKARNILSENFAIHRHLPIETKVSKDNTRKYLFHADNNKYIESVYIPENNRSTLCISTQVGCGMGCVFCMTGKQGFNGNLTTGEILNQITSVAERDYLSNIVFMGMGEPLANTENVIKSIDIMCGQYGFGWSPSRITISTIGILPGLIKVIEETNCHIAISMHSPFPEERLKLLPSEKIYPIKRIVEYLKTIKIKRHRRISFEYIMFKDLNDTMHHVNGITSLLNGLRCRINLIRFHPVPGVQLIPSPDDNILRFKNRLNEKGVLTTVRASRGQDIDAACGMLSTKYKTEKVN
jgi:23S rRNA (adenine2503-C2)-methyltransferase